MFDLVEHLDMKKDRIKYHGDSLEMAFLEELIKYLNYISENVHSECLDEGDLDDARDEGIEEGRIEAKQNVTSLFEELKK